MPSRDLKIQILGDASGLFRTLGKAGGELRRFGSTADSASKGTSRMSKATHAFKVAGLAAIPVAGLVVYQLHSMVQAAADAQAEQNRLRQALNVSGISYKRYGKHIDEVLTSESLLSGFTKRDLTASFAVFARATDSLTGATRLQADAMDLARAKGEDLASATQTLITIQAGSYRSLKTLGIQYTAVTPNLDRLRATVKNYTKAQEDAAKKEDLGANKTRVLAILHQRLKGSMQAFGKTAQGALDKLNSAWDEMKVKIGTALLPAITQLANSVSKYLAKASTQRSINHLVQTAGRIIRTEVIPAVQQLKTAFDDVATVVEHIAYITSTIKDVLSPATGQARAHQKQISKGTGVVGRASGGPVLAGHSYMINEQGPELLTLFPGGGGHVTSHRESHQPAGGLTVKQYFSNSVDPRAAMTEAFWSARRLMPQAVA